MTATSFRKLILESCIALYHCIELKSEFLDVDLSQGDNVANLRNIYKNYFQLFFILALMTAF